MRPKTRELVKVVNGVRILVRLNEHKNGWRVNTAFPEAADKKGVNT